MSLHIAVLLGTVREGRQSEHVARFILQRLKARSVDASLVDPATLWFGDLAHKALDAETATGAKLDFIRAMTQADGFVIVTPEYNYSFPGALKNLLDVTHKPWNRKPFGLVGAGGVSGGLRAIDSLRQVITGLAAITVPAHVPVQSVGKTFGPDGPLVDVEAWTNRIDRFLDEVLWYAEALKAARAGPVQV
jgi:NAD(P)H-dependent FMN reductase